MTLIIVNDICNPFTPNFPINSTKSQHPPIQPTALSPPTSPSGLLKTQPPNNKTLFNGTTNASSPHTHNLPHQLFLNYTILTVRASGSSTMATPYSCNFVQKPLPHRAIIHISAPSPPTSYAPRKSTHHPRTVLINYQKFGVAISFCSVAESTSPRKCPPGMAYSSLYVPRSTI